ncbi:MAG: hypothetical protein ACLUT5_03320 [Butyricicoccus sp.]
MQRKFFSETPVSDRFKSAPARTFGVIQGVRKRAAATANTSFTRKFPASQFPLQLHIVPFLYRPLGYSRGRFYFTTN